MEQTIAFNDLLVNDFDWLAQEVLQSQLPAYVPVSGREVYAPLRKLDQVHAHPSPPNPVTWEHLSGLLNEIWAAKREVIESGSTHRTFEASLIPSDILRDIAQRAYYSTLERWEEKGKAELAQLAKDRSKQGVLAYMEAEERIWTQARTQARLLAMNHPATLSLQDRHYPGFDRLFGEIL